MIFLSYDKDIMFLIINTMTEKMGNRHEQAFLRIIRAYENKLILKSKTTSFFPL